MSGSSFRWQSRFVRIREADLADAESLAELSGQLGYALERAAVTHHLEAIAAHRAGVVLVAETGAARVVGMAHAIPQWFITDGSFVELAALVVDAGARGARVGAALLAAIEQWARAQGFDAVHVHSNVIRERAHRFYLREGYAEWKRQAVFRKRL